MSPENGQDAARRLTVLGVRHHSPACARMVRKTIVEKAPRHVLIEGPCDFNDHMDDLRRPHELPVAIFSYRASGATAFSSYAPFCGFSPEWVALQTAWEVEAEPFFCDLPAWSDEFGARSNRYADPHGARVAAVGAAVAKALGEGDDGAVWDVLAEQAEDEELPDRLDRYFDLLRPDAVEDEREAARESFMAAWARWALGRSRDGEVVLVCGGWHADAIRRLAVESGEPPANPPAVAVEGEDRTGSYLVPFDYPRLDRFSGYAAGMPSPGYYEALAGLGIDAAAERAIAAIAAALREARQVVSTADCIAWRLHAEALARARGHRGVLRTDLLDAALSSLIKEGLERPANWDGPEPDGSGAHPAIAVMLRALAGTRRGKLAAGVRQPPLIAELHAALDRLDLRPGPVRRLELDWSQPADRERAGVLHRMRILGLPGVERVSGPSAPRTDAPREVFSLYRHRDADGAAIEAARWGGTLRMAAANRLAASVSAAGDDLDRLTICLSDALFADLLTPASGLAKDISTGIARARELAALGAPALRAIRLHRFGGVFGEEAQKALGEICEAVFARVLWLIETTTPSGAAVADPLIACRDMARDCPGLSIDREGMFASLQRCILSPRTPPTLAGAATGFLIACRRAEEAGLERRLPDYAAPERLGDYLCGVFALAREEVAGRAALMEAARGTVAEWDDDAFLVALPALRQAFAWFPPRERERIAHGLLQGLGMGEAEAGVTAHGWMRQRVDPALQAAAATLEAAVFRKLARAGLIENSPAMEA